MLFYYAFYKTIIVSFILFPEFFIDKLFCYVFGENALKL